MTAPVAVIVAWCALSAPIVLLALGIRHPLNIKDLKHTAAGTPYSRRYRVCEQSTMPDIRDRTDVEALVVQTPEKSHFPVVRGPNSILAVSPVWAGCRVFVSVSRDNCPTLSTFDRFLQPLMVGFVERRFRNCMRALIEEIKQTVEKGHERGRM